MKIFNSPKIELLKKSLDVYAKQHQAISENIANANNEGFKRVDTDFSSVLNKNLDQSLKVSHPRHISEAKAPDTGGTPVDSSQKVDLSQEMGQLAENQIRYDFATRALARAYRGISTSIIGRNS